MGRAKRRFEPWLIVLGSISLVGWVALGGSGSTSHLMCFTGALGAAPLAAWFGLAPIIDSPMTLVYGWTLMVAAMMPPLIVAPLRNVRDRSFARCRARATLLFLAGYTAMWMGAGVLLTAMALAARSAMPGPLFSLWIAVAAAMLWQVSPAKQWCLNRCHRQPQLAAFGTTADRDALAFGLMHGASCVGACWAPMLVPLFIEQDHFLAMIVVTLFVFAERLERPAPLEWRWRGPGKGLRIVVAQAQIRLNSLLRLREASR